MVFCTFPWVFAYNAYFAYNASRLWNALPGRIRAADTVEKFKKDVKTLLFDGHGELKRRAFKYCV